MHAIRFSDPASLREERLQLGLLRSRARVEHVAAWVSNLDRARGFYERWFHAASTPEYSSAKHDFRSRFLSLGGGPRLELMVSPQEPPRHAHIAISVGSRQAWIVWSRKWKKRAFRLSADQELREMDTMKP
jgi:catechol 2,3-dioxygenase-like lactoylglutathione lyase family enzyme